MINWNTPVEPGIAAFKLDYTDKLLFCGSCFAENMGQQFQRAKFTVEVNPFGTLFNPISIAQALERADQNHSFETADLIEHQGMWHSWYHQSLYSEPDRDSIINKLNNKLQQTHQFYQSTNTLVLTFGTAWVYEYLETGQVVANCHKIPAKRFRRRLLTIDEITERLNSLISRFLQNKPNARVVLTVSPVRHLKDGAHGNQLSKAVLLLAVEKLCQQSGVYYFPAYEIMLDELRDYRFYSADLCHPSEEAVRHIFEVFCATYLLDSAQQTMNEIMRLQTSLEHRPLHPDAPSFTRFIQQVSATIERLAQQYPTIDFEPERRKLLER